MDAKMQRHLEGCKLTEKRYKKLEGILKKMRDGDSTKNRDDLLEKFADKCYNKEPDRAVALQQAQQFLEALYGTVDDIYSLGPEKAIAKRIQNLYDMITPTELRKKGSEKFNALNHGKKLDKEENIADSEIWTFKLDRFLVGPTLGVGGTATVKLAYDTRSKEQVALKILQPKYAFSAKKEMDILKKLNHDNIIRIYDCFDNVLWQKKKTTVFAIEYADGGELIEYLMYTSKFEAPLARWFFKKLVDGVAYCHDQDIVHRDLKHDNCLLGHDFNLKITDFGFARKYFKDNAEQMKTAIGTAQYAAPEILAQKKYNEKVDIFSMGVMLFIALAGSQPWRKADPHTDRWYNWTYNKQWTKFWDYHADRSHEFKDDAKELLEGMLAHKPKNRWSIEDIKQCKWFHGKRMDNAAAEKALKKRKRTMDQKKFDAAEREVSSRKAVPGVPEQKSDMMSEDKKKLLMKSDPPFCDILKIPLTSFYTTENAVLALEQIVNAIASLKGDTLWDKKAEDEDKKFELTFEVKKAHGFPLKGEEKDAAYLIKGKVNVYKESKDSRRNLVVVSNNGDFTSRMYLPQVFNDMMGQIAIIRSDVKKSEESKEDE